MTAQQDFTKSKQSCQNGQDEIAVLCSQLDNIKELNKKLAEQIIGLEADNGVMSIELEKMHNQLSKQTDDNQLVNECLDTVKKENDELKNRLQLIENINASELISAEDEDDPSDTNKNLTSSWNKTAIMDWLNKSDLRHLRESEDIINAMCNVSKNHNKKIRYSYSYSILFY